MAVSTSTNESDEYSADPNPKESHEFSADPNPKDSHVYRKDGSQKTYDPCGVEYMFDRMNAINI